MKLGLRVCFKCLFGDGSFEARHGLCVACYGEFGEALWTEAGIDEGNGTREGYFVSACVQHTVKASQRRACRKLNGALRRF